METFGAGSLCVGNVSDDPDIEDVAVVIGSAGDGDGKTEGGSEEVKDAWRVLVDKLGLDLSDVCPLLHSHSIPGTLSLELTSATTPHDR